MQSSTERTTISRAGATWLLALLCAFAVAALVTMDPLISAVFPRSLWQVLSLDASPVRVSLLLIPLAALTWLGIHAAARAPNYRRAFLALLAVASQVGGFNFGPIDMLDIVTLIAVMALLLEIAMEPTTPLRLPALILFGLLFLVLDIPYLATLGPGPFLIGFIKFFKTILLAFVLVNIIRDESDIRFFIRMVLIVAVISALIGIVQSAVYFLTGNAYTLMDEFEDAFKPTPLGYILRSSALCPSAQFFSSFLLTSIPLFLLQLLYSEPGWPRFRILAGLGIVLAGILFSWNYGAILTAGGMLMLAPFLIWPSRIIHLVIGMAFLVVAFYYAGILEWMWDNSLGDSGVFKGVSQRQSLLLAGFEQILRNPLVGTGLDGFSFYTHHIFGRPVHNAGVQIWSELGFVAMIGFVAMVLILITQTFILAYSGSGYTSDRFRVLLVGLIGLAQLMFSEPFMNSQTVWLYLALVQVCIIMAARQPARDTR